MESWVFLVIGFVLGAAFALLGGVLAEAFRSRQAAQGVARAVQAELGDQRAILESRPRDTYPNSELVTAEYLEWDSWLSGRDVLLATYSVEDVQPLLHWYSVIRRHRQGGQPTSIKQADADLVAAEDCARSLAARSPWLPR